MRGIHPLVLLALGSASLSTPAEAHLRAGAAAGPPPDGAPASPGAAGNATALVEVNQTSTAAGGYSDKYKPLLLNASLTKDQLGRQASNVTVTLPNQVGLLVDNYVMGLREGEVNATKILKDVNLTYVTGKVEAWKRQENAKELSKMIPKDAKRGYKASKKYFKKSVKVLEKFLAKNLKKYRKQDIKLFTKGMKKIRKFYKSNEKKFTKFNKRMRKSEGKMVKRLEKLPKKVDKTTKKAKSKLAKYSQKAFDYVAGVSDDAITTQLEVMKRFGTIDKLNTNQMIGMNMRVSRAEALMEQYDNTVGPAIKRFAQQMALRLEEFQARVKIRFKDSLKLNILDRQMMDNRLERVEQRAEVENWRFGKAFESQVKLANGVIKIAVRGMQKPLALVKSQANVLRQMLNERDRLVQQYFKRARVSIFDSFEDCMGVIYKQYGMLQQMMDSSVVSLNSHLSKDTTKFISKGKFQLDLILMNYQTYFAEINNMLYTQELEMEGVVMETHKSFDGPSGVYTNFARADRLFAVPGVMEGIVNDTQEALDTSRSEALHMRNRSLGGLVDLLMGGSVEVKDLLRHLHPGGARKNVSFEIIARTAKAMQSVYAVAREMTNQSDWMKTQMVAMAEGMSQTEATLNQWIIDMNELKDRAKVAKKQISSFAREALVLNDFFREFFIKKTKNDLSQETDKGVKQIGSSQETQLEADAKYKDTVKEQTALVKQLVEDTSTKVRDRMGAQKVEAVALETAGETMDKEGKEMGTDSAAFNQGFNELSADTAAEIAVTAEKSLSGLKELKNAVNAQADRTSKVMSEKRESLLKSVKSKTSSTSANSLNFINNVINMLGSEVTGMETKSDLKLAMVAQLLSGSLAKHIDGLKHLSADGFSLIAALVTNSSQELQLIPKIDAGVEVAKQDLKQHLRDTMVKAAQQLIYGPGGANSKIRLMDDQFRDLVAGADGIASNEAEAFREKSLLLEGAANENGAKAELSAQDAEARAKAALLKIQEIMAALHGHSAHVVGDYEKDGERREMMAKMAAYDAAKMQESNRAIVGGMEYTIARGVNSSDEKEAKTHAALQAILNKTNPQALTKKSKDGILKLVQKREQSIEEEMSKVNSFSDLIDMLTRTFNQGLSKAAQPLVDLRNVVKKQTMEIQAEFRPLNVTLDGESRKEDNLMERTRDQSVRIGNLIGMRGELMQRRFKKLEARFANLIGGGSYKQSSMLEQTVHGLDDTLRAQDAVSRRSQSLSGAEARWRERLEEVVQNLAATVSFPSHELSGAPLVLKDATQSMLDTIANRYAGPRDALDRLEAKFKFYINDVLRSRYRHDSRHDTAVKMMALANASLPSDTAPVPALVKLDRALAAAATKGATGAGAVRDRAVAALAALARHGRAKLPAMSALADLAAAERKRRARSRGRTAFVQEYSADGEPEEVRGAELFRTFGAGLAAAGDARSRSDAGLVSGLRKLVAGQ